MSCLLFRLYDPDSAIWAISGCGWGSETSSANMSNSSHMLVKQYLDKLDADPNLQTNEIS